MKAVKWTGWVIVWIVLVIFAFLIARTVFFGTIILVGVPAGLLVGALFKRILGLKADERDEKGVYQPKMPAFQ